MQFFSNSNTRFKSNHASLWSPTIHVTNHKIYYWLILLHSSFVFVSLFINFHVRRWIQLMHNIDQLFNKLFDRLIFRKKKLIRSFMLPYHMILLLIILTESFVFVFVFLYEIRRKTWLEKHSRILSQLWPDFSSKKNSLSWFRFRNEHKRQTPLSFCVNFHLLTRRWWFLLLLLSCGTYTNRVMLTFSVSFPGRKLSLVTSPPWRSRSWRRS